MRYFDQLTKAHHRGAEITPAMNTSLELKRDLVRRIVESRAFAKSERLSSFLVCISDLTLSGRANEINEQKIGTAVFGRAPGYDCAIDGIVRPQASRLRQRLDLYFKGEGSTEPIRITLPRGSYVPLFEPNEAQVETHASLVPAPSPVPVHEHVVTTPPPARKVRTWWLSVSLAACLLLLGTFVVVTHKPTQIGPAPGEEHALWGQIFRPKRKTIVVPSDTGFVLWQSTTGKYINLAGYLSGRYRAQSAGDVPKHQVDPADLASRRYTSIVDLRIIKQLTQVADAHKIDLEVSYARDFQMDELKNSNVVLLGAAASNPWVELLEPKMNFVFSDAQLRQYTVLNRAPRGAEPPKWTADYDDPHHHAYGVVAFLPNLGGTGDVLLLEGTSMAGTQSAWDFVNDSAAFRAFVKQAARADGTLRYFQLVLQSENYGGSAINKKVVAWRISG